MSPFRKNDKIKFTSEEEEILIDFIKNNEILYNVRHKRYRDADAKNRLWLRLARKIGKDGELSNVYMNNIFHFTIEMTFGFISDEAGSLLS